MDLITNNIDLVVQEVLMTRVSRGIVDEGNFPTETLFEHLGIFEGDHRKVLTECLQRFGQDLMQRFDQYRFNDEVTLRLYLQSRMINGDVYLNAIPPPRELYDNSIFPAQDVQFQCVPGLFAWG